MTRSLQPASERLYYIWILTAFAISRLLYYAAGVRFQTDLIRSNFQFIDVDLLQHRLWESLFYYHMQPPLHNLILGLLVKLFPGDYGIAMHGFYIVCGVVSSLLLYRLMRCLGAGAPFACLLTILFVTSPGCILFENYPMYEYLILMLLLAQCVALNALLRQPSFWRAFFFFALLAALAMLRAFYHLYYLAAVAVSLAFLLPLHRRMIAAAAAVPLLLVSALYVKNLLVFGFFGGSSWLGNNLPTVTTHNLTREECRSLVVSGNLDPFGCVEGGMPPSVYLPYVPDLKKTGIPVLDDPVKSTGDPNYNHEVYLRTGPMFTRAAKEVLRYYPLAYLRSVAIAWFCYFRPPSDFFQFQENLAHIRRFERLYDLILFGERDQASGRELRAMAASGAKLGLLMYTGVFLIFALPGIVGTTIYFWIRDQIHHSPDLPRQALIAFIVVQIFLVAGIANFLSSFENNRYRFPTDALFVALSSVLLARLLVKHAFFTGKEPD